MKRFLICLTIGLFVFIGVPVQAEIKGKPEEGEVYEEVKTKEARLYNKRSINTSEEKLEVKEKIAEMSNYKMLQSKTESNYEVALAYSDGSYRYMNDTNYFENALVEVNELEKSYNDNTVIPAIINNDGQVIYSTNSMGNLES
jgi:hypothetical protein